MVKWMAANDRRDLNVQGRCDRPFRMKDNKVAQLNKKEMVCDKLKLPVMSFGPQGDQIAFKGDRTTFVCNSSWVPGMQITWYKDDKLITRDPNDKRKNILYEFDSSKVVNSTVLDIMQLTVEDSGFYSCNVTHKGGYLHMSTSHLAVIPSDAKFCRAASTETDRGTFHWHHTAAGGFAFLPCPVGVISSLLDHQGAEIMARRNCSLEGVWMAVEAEPCAHANEITRALYDLKQKTVNDTTVNAVSHQLLNISKRAREFSDPLDVIYAAVVVEKLAQVIGRDEYLNENLVDTISNIMETEVALLQEAQRRSKACSRFVP
ncbi:adhesion G protein-coupled receptor A3-like [Oculina patagonica]